MTESTVTPFEDFSQRLRRKVAERDEAVEAIDSDYAKRLAAGAAGDLYRPYRAERASAVNMFKLEAISVGKDYIHVAPAGSPALPEPPAPSAAYPPPHGETVPAMTANQPIQQPELREPRSRRKAKVIGFVGAGIVTLGLIFTVSSIASNSPTIDRDAVFLDNYDPPSSDSDLVEMANGACTSLKEGTTMKEIQKAVAATDLSHADKVELATIVGYGIGVYCPEFS